MLASANPQTPWLGSTCAALVKERGHALSVNEDLLAEEVPFLLSGATGLLHIIEMAMDSTFRRQ